ATGVNPSTLSYDNTATTVDIASAGTCTDTAGTVNYGMHATTPYQVSYSDGSASPIATCDGTLSYTISTPWNTSSGISFTGTDGNYYCIKLECQDASGKITTSYSADNIQYDVTKPVVASTEITPDPAKAGTINVTVKYTETGSGLDYTLSPTVEFTPSGGAAVTVTKSTYAANQWTGTATVLPGHNNGTATLSVGGSTDKAGNTMDVDTTGSFVIDTVAPNAPVVVSPGTTTVVINIANKSAQVIAGSAEADSTVKLYVDSVDSGLSTTATSGSYSFSNENLTTAGIVSGTDYSTPKAVTLTATDAAGNESVVSTAYNYVQDTIAPTITSITSDATASGVLKVANSITFTLTPSTTELGASVSGSYNSEVLSWSTDNSGVTYTGTYTINEGENDQTSPLQITGVTITDAAGNTSTPADGSDVNKTIDANTPAIVSVVSDATASGVLKVDNEIVFTVTPTVTETGLTVLPAVYNGGALSWSTVDGSDYTATYIVVEGQADQSTPLQLTNVTLTDPAGNISTSKDGTDVNKTIDANSPVVSALAVSPGSGTARVSDTVVLTITADEAGYSADAVVVNGVDVASSNFQDLGGGVYSVDYVVSEGDSDVLSGAMTASVVLSDVAGNLNPVFTSVDANTLAVDANSPTVSLVTSDATGAGVLKVGESITFTVSPLVAETGLTVLPASYNGGALAWSTGDGGVTYTATYAVVEGQADQLAPLQLVNVTLTDPAGNISAAVNGTDVNKTIDANTPAVPVISVPATNPYEITQVTKPTVTLSGTAEPNSTVKLFVDGADSNVSISADGSGDFNFSNANLETAGIVSATDYSTPKAVTLTATDAAGNSSVPTADFNFTQVTDSVPPTFTMTYYLDAGLLIAPSPPVHLKAGTYYVKVEANEALQAAPTYSVEAEGTANDVSSQTMTLVSGNVYMFTRTIAVDVAAVGTVAEDVTVTASDLAGNPVTDLSLAGGAYTDTTPPAKPTITSPADNEMLVTSTTTVAGGAESDATVNVYVKGSLSKSVTATSGSYSASSVGLAAGDNAIFVTAVDLAGNESVQSDTITVTRLGGGTGGGGTSGGSTTEGVSCIEILNYPILTHINGEKGERTKLELGLANVSGFLIYGEDVKIEFESDCSDCFSFTNPTIPEKFLIYEPVDMTVYATALKELDTGSYKITAVVTFRDDPADLRTMTLVVSESKAEKQMPVITREIKHQKRYEEETTGLRTDLYDYPKSTITLRVRNPTGETMRNVRVRETIPKSVLSNVNETVFDRKTRKDIPKAIFNGNYIVIEEDPVIEWIIDSLLPGQEVEVGYEILQVETASGLFTDPAIEFEGMPEEEPEQQAVCGDGVCQDTENSANCCTDCDCDWQNQVCQNNECTIVIDVDDSEILPPDDDEETGSEDKEPEEIVPPADQLQTGLILMGGLLLIVVLLVAYVKRKLVRDFWNDLMFDYNYNKLKRKEEKHKKSNPHKPIVHKHSKKK
ncbi:MAG: hypothetical protein J7K00_02670, partial [Candidatus Diapherotrites archaeon]|nr:hypothetical protein [Candidatus Diapherotrites archaeon]